MLIPFIEFPVTRSAARYQKGSKAAGRSGPEQEVDNGQADRMR